MNSQLDLNLQVTNNAGLHEFLAVLDRHTGWLTADDVLVRLGYYPDESRKRWLRHLSELADGQIISGQAGYRATRHATVEEIHHAAAWLRHQAQRMDAKASAILRAGHELINQG